MKVIVLRLSHRVFRDKRLSTHVCLTARALGADEVFVSGEKDKGMINSVKDVCKKWGGDFKIKYVKNSLNFLKSKKKENWEIIHLTMYGLPYQKEISKIKKSEKNKVLVVGGEKVPPEIYEIADYNLSVTQQPHSEVGALALFLHDFFEGMELDKIFEDSDISIIPQKKGKKFK